MYSRALPLESAEYNRLQPMEPSGLQWSPMAPSGVQWCPMDYNDANGVLWSPMGPDSIGIIAAHRGPLESSGARRSP
eukprot:11205124-Lingulodinium_polyedra.AAC.1